MYNEIHILVDNQFEAMGPYSNPLLDPSMDEVTRRWDSIERMVQQRIDEMRENIERRRDTFEGGDSPMADTPSECFDDY
jgi:hypothetical protein